MIRPQFSLDLNNELIVDNFAGGGGASTGIELALGRHVDIAINHDPEAIAMHQANHPQTLHLCESVFDVDPVKVTAGRPVGLAWFSPDCTHFSKARGTKPRSKKIRGLAWIIVRWAFLVRPRVTMMENVEEFLSWGPLGEDGQPCPINKGRTFQSFRSVMTTGISRDNPDVPEILETVGSGITVDDLVAGMGYGFDFLEERACNHSAPTIRKRLFGIARRDQKQIVWPAATHGDPKRKEFKKSGLRPFRTAAECIDFTLPCPSIFTRKRPLAEATCRRIAKGIMRYVVNCADPFIVPITHHGESDRVTTMGNPIPTVTAAHRGEMALVAPLLTEHANASNPRCNSVDAPLRTQCANVKGGHFSVVAPVLVSRHSDNGTDVRASAADAPVKTITGSGGPGVVAAFLAKHYGGVVGQQIEQALGTVTSTDHHSLVSAHLTKFRTGSTGSDMSEPVHTITAGPKENPAGAPHAMGVVAAHLSKLRGDADTHAPGQEVTQPLHTVSAQGNHFADVRAFLIKYYGNEKEAHELPDPMGTVTTKDRFGLVTIKGEEFAIVDIGLRMLAPRELYRAQGFPDSYIIGDNPAQGLVLTKSAQVRMCGNSVCPPMAAALVRANVPELSVWSSDEQKRRSA